jgi:integrase
MPRRPNPIPTYRLHKQSGQAVVALRQPDGSRKFILLGTYGTDTSKAEYERVLAEWRATGGRPVATSGLTMNELLVSFWSHAQQHYRHADGSPTNELNDYRLTLKPLKALYGHTLAAEFGPLALKAVRQSMIDADLCRNVVNQRIGRIKRLFKWAVSEELVPTAVYAAVATVAGLAKGRSSAREREPVRPVADAIVDAVQPHVLPEVWAMTQVQRLSGARPGEVCALRAIDIDMSGPIWLFRPKHHKTAWRGKGRVIALGPRAQAVIRPFLSLDLQAYLFSPKRALAARAERLRANRRTRVQPSQLNRRTKQPKRTIGDKYTVQAYLTTIRRACTRAFPPPSELARRAGEKVAAWRHRLGPEKWSELTAWQSMHHWHPNQLRHSFATTVRRDHGLEAAQVTLGHAQAQVTQVYAERDLTLALKVAAAVG